MPALREKGKGEHQPGDIQPADMKFRQHQGNDCGGEPEDEQRIRIARPGRVAQDELRTGGEYCGGQQ
ncbi:hypothetical protein D3C71_1264020 [compost metagenome]